MDDLFADRVSSLINHQTRSWDESLLATLFSPREAQLVKSIPLSNVFPEDCLYWPHTSLGTYTVKTGYKSLTLDLAQQDADGVLKFIPWYLDKYLES